MIYGLEVETGRIYTEEEYWEYYKDALPDHGVVGSCWDNLPKVDVEEGRLEHTRKRMLHI